jgi:hypothetical protein
MPGGVSVTQFGEEKPSVNIPAFTYNRAGPASVPRKGVGVGSPYLMDPS